jgi:hypothetical protein
MADGYFIVPRSYLGHPTIKDLIDRKNEIETKLMPYVRPKLRQSERCDLLHELHIVINEIGDRSFYGRFGEATKNGKKIFISYSKKDVGFARMLHDDLKKLGHKPWLDEFNIKAGSSIPLELQRGIAECDYLVVLLSKNSVFSNWVKVEWVTKFWHEVEREEVYVIPAKIQECEIPPLLKHKKYANFMRDFQEGLFEVLQAIDH